MRLTLLLISFVGNKKRAVEVLRQFRIRRDMLTDTLAVTMLLIRLRLTDVGFRLMTTDNEG